MITYTSTDRNNYVVINETTKQVVQEIDASVAQEAFLLWENSGLNQGKPFALYLRVGYQD